MADDMLGRKDDTDKKDWSLLPLDSINSIIDVLMHGAKKYSPDNWKAVNDAKRRYYNATMRHLTEWYSGDIYDKESGYSHLSHAGCCILFLISLELSDKLK